MLPPPPEPQAVPVLEMVPMVSKVAQPAAPPAEETMRLVVEAVPALSTVKIVVDAELITSNDLRLLIQLFRSTLLKSSNS